LDFVIYLEFGIGILGFPSFLLTPLNTHAQTKWYKYPGNPVFHPGGPGEWDQNISFPVVIYDGGKYHMWYRGDAEKLFDHRSSEYATSDDGIHWVKHPDPVL
jgi:hypothetical protein